MHEAYPGRRNARLLQARGVAGEGGLRGGVKSGYEHKGASMTLYLLHIRGMHRQTGIATEPLRMRLGVLGLSQRGLRVYVGFTFMVIDILGLGTIDPKGRGTDGALLYGCEEARPHVRLNTV